MAAGPTAAEAIRVFIVDDHAIVRHGLTSYLSVAAGIDVVGEAADGAEAVAAIADLISTGRAPDVALVDLVMPGLDGIGVAEALRGLPGSPRVVILSSFGEVEHLRSALRAGVSGYVLKSTPAEAIADAIRAVSSGKLQLDPALSGSLAEAVSPSGAAVSLTAREREVVALVARGKSNRDVAAAMYISERTARTHVSHLLGKLGLESRIQLAIWAHANGFPLASPDEIARAGSHRASGSLARIRRRTAAGALLVVRRPGPLGAGRWEPCGPRHLSRFISRLVPVPVTIAGRENSVCGTGVGPGAVAHRGLTSKKLIGERVKELSGKVAFVTGSAGGIGLGIARAFAEAGMKIVLSDIDGPALEQSAAELAKETRAEVIAVPLDVTDRDGWARVALEVPAALGPVQLLVNNAGVSTLGMRFDEIGPELWDRVISINLTGVYNGVHYFLDGMRAAGGGHIVNTSSMGGLIGFPTLSPYSASKFAVVGLSEALNAELAESGIGVSVLAPGGVRSRLWRTSRAVRGLPDTDVPPSDASGQSAGPGGMDPYEVGRRVLDAVIADELYVITHPEMRDFVTQRHQRMMHGFDRAEAFAK